MKKQKPRALVIDGNYLMYRCHYGLQPLTTPGGQVIHGAYGTILRVREAMKLFNPSKVVVCWDGSQSYKSWRHDRYPPYKSRPKTDEKLLTRSIVDEQIGIASKILGDDLLIPQVRSPLVEGDDACSVAAERLVKEGYKPVVMSPDHDYIQLVEREVTVYDPMKVVWYNLANFEAETGCKTPSEYMDWMVVNGDPGDGVPMVKGLSGEKRWEKWAAQIELPLHHMLESKDQFRLNCPRGMLELFLPRYDELKRNWELLDLRYARGIVREDVAEFWPHEHHDYDRERFVKSCRKYAFNSILMEIEEWDRDIIAYHERAKR